jgi:hypothetical protein
MMKGIPKTFVAYREEASFQTPKKIKIVTHLFQIFDGAIARLDISTRLGVTKLLPPRAPLKLGRGFSVK